MAARARSPVFFWIAVGVACALLAGRWLFKRRRPPEVASVSALVLATVAIGFLIVSAGTITGLNTLLLLPLFFSALYGRPWESAVVIPVVGITVAILGVNADDTVTVLVRFVLFWLTLMTMISFTTHVLRARLAAIVADAEEGARQSAVMAQATQTSPRSWIPTTLCVWRPS